MENPLIAKWILGLFTAFAGVLAIGKLLSERDEARGYCNVRFAQKKKRSEWFEKHIVEPKTEKEEKQ